MERTIVGKIDEQIVRMRGASADSAIANIHCIAYFRTGAVDVYQRGVHRGIAVPGAISGVIHQICPRRPIGLRNNQFVNRLVAGINGVVDLK